MRRMCGSLGQWKLSHLPLGGFQVFVCVVGGGWGRSRVEEIKPLAFVVALRITEVEEEYLIQRKSVTSFESKLGQPFRK